MGKNNIMVISLDNRYDKAQEVQKLLTDFGCSIKMRLGLHEADDVCSENGLILLQLVDTQENIRLFEKNLGSINGVKVKTINI